MPNIDISEGRKRLYFDDFTGGANLFVHPTKLPDNEFPVFENVMVRASGSNSGGNYITADKRQGFERYNTNIVDTAAIRSISEYITQNKTTNLQRLVANTAGGLMKYTDAITGEYSGAWSLISNAETDGKMKYVTFRDNLYIANRNSGADVNKFYDGTNYLDVGCPPCDNDVNGITRLAATTGGDLSAGNYLYIITFVYDNAQESSAILRAQTYTLGTTPNTPIFRENINWTGAAAGQAINITYIPTGNARVTQRKIYRSKVDDFSLIYYLGTIYDNVTTIYKDTMADTDLSRGFDPYLLLNDLKRPYKSKYHFTHDNSMIQLSITDDLFKPIPVGDIALTEVSTGGGMTAGIYKYRFFKIWAINAGGKIIFKISMPQTKTITLTTGDSVNITVTGDGWFNAVAVQRTIVGGSEFKFCINPAVAYGQLSVFGIPIGAPPTLDNLADAALYSSSAWQVDFKDVLVFKNFITKSDPGCPDLFSEGSEMEIGDNNDEITGGFSRYSAIDVFKRNAIHRIMTANDIWQERKIVSGIGAAFPESIVHMPDDTYVFCGKKRSGLTEYPVFYEWDGNNAPREISKKIQTYLNTVTISDMDGAYDNTNKCVRFTYTTGSYKGEELVYDLIQRDSEGVGLWYFNHRNTGDLELRCPFYTNGNKLLYGHEQGYIYHQYINNQDKLGAGNTTVQINARVQSKTQEVAFGALKIKRMMTNILASGSGAANGLAVIFGADETETPIAATLALGENRIRIPCNIAAKRFYVRLENAENINIKFRMLGWDYAVRHMRDSSGVTITIPAAVSLLLPVDGDVTVIADNADFSWTAIANTIYQIQVATDVNFTAIVYDQDRIKYAAFTLPNGILSGSTTYYWRVRALNGVSYGDWSTVRSFGTSFVYDTDAMALFARMVIQPTAGRKTLINTLILGLKADGIWTKLDCFWMFAHETNTNYEALLNWKGVKNNCGYIGPTTFTTDRGILTGSFALKHINTNFNPSIEGVNYLQNSASVFFYSRTNTTGSDDMGISGTICLQMVSKYSDGNCYMGINAGLSNRIIVAMTDSLALIGLNRSGANDIQAYQRGVSFGSSSISASTGLPIGPIGIGNWIPLDDSPAARQYACAGVGGSLTATDWSNLYARIQTFMKAIGANV